MDKLPDTFALPSWALPDSEAEELYEAAALTGSAGTMLVVGRQGGV